MIEIEAAAERWRRFFHGEMGSLERDEYYYGSLSVEDRDALCQWALNRIIADRLEREERERLKQLAQDAFDDLDTLRRFIDDRPRALHLRQAAANSVEDLLAALGVERKGGAPREYRRLKHGEIIHAGDEIDRCADAWRDDAKWEPVHPNDIGQPAPDQRYPAHRQYRRKLDVEQKGGDA